MPKTIYEFNTPGNYTLNNTKIEDSKASLGLIPNPNQIFSNTFDDDTGFNQDDPNLSEFVAGVLRAKDQTPANSVLYSALKAKDLNWRKSAGALTGTLRNTPTFSASGMTCTGSQGVEWDGVSKANETLVVKYTPNYTGTPPDNINIIGTSGSGGSGNLDRFHLTHSPSGDNFRLTIRDVSGNLLQNAVTIGPSSINLQAGTTYFLAVALDTTTKRVNLYIKVGAGAWSLHGVSTSALGTWTRGGVSLKYKVGADVAVYDRAEASFAAFSNYDALLVPTTTPVTDSLPNTIYAETKIDGPVFTYTGVGTVLTVDDATFVEAGSGRYIVAGRYWNGSSWAVSDGTYAQANDSATLIANLAALNATGAEFIPWSVVFPDSNTQASIDSFIVEVTGQIISPTGSLTTDSYFVTNAIQGFVADGIVVPSGDYIGFFAVVGLTTKYYHDGTNWVESDGNSQAQTNSYADFVSNISTLVANNVQVQLGIYMESGDQSTTPSIDQACFEHNFGALNPGELLRCNVYMYLADLEGQPLEDVTVTVKLLRETTQYAEAASYVVAGSLSKDSDDEGFVSFALIRSSEFEVAAGTMKYVIEFKLADRTVNNIELDADQLPQPIEFEVPDLESVNLTGQVMAS